MICNTCSNNNLNIKKYNSQFDYLNILIKHVNDIITYETFNDENYVNIIFQKLILHCTPKGMKVPNKKNLANEYKFRIENNLINSNQIFEKLIFKISNGELCISVPSKALESCPFNCAFCPTSNKNNELYIAKSYTIGQPVFAKLVNNNNNLIKYLLQHIISQYDMSYDITKLAMRHLGGTFSTYPKLYRYEYSRDIFYAVNIIPLIINNNKLLNLAKKSLNRLFDPDEIIINQLRKPFNYDKISKIENKINECKLWGDKYNDEIKKLEFKLLDELEISLKLEQDYNVSSYCKIVSYSIETRPDTINITSITEFLKLGVTIVELGLQSTNNEILKIVKRGHIVEDSIKAIQMIKNHGLHIHGQWMLDLPSSTKELDLECINKILSEELRCDQIKIYPHLIMPNTETKEWLDNKIYSSWVENDEQGFIDLMTYFVSSIDETTRIIRIQRDLPKYSEKNQDGYTNNQNPNLEQIITKNIYLLGKTREDINFHEPGLRFANLQDIKYYIDIKKNLSGIDIFISAQSYISNNNNKNIKDFRIIWGYCRLRIVDNNDDIQLIKFFKSNNKYGRIRELKVNGSIQSVGTCGKSVQHRGIGSKLLNIAEEIALKYSMTHVTVTSAIGVRDYYRLKHGYQLDSSGLMWKKLTPIKFRKLIQINQTKFIILDNNYYTRYTYFLDYLQIILKNMYKQIFQQYNIYLILFLLCIFFKLFIIIQKIMCK